jgi:hypothetical protein
VIQWHPYPGPLGFITYIHWVKQARTNRFLWVRIGCEDITHIYSIPLTPNSSLAFLVNFVG